MHQLIVKSKLLNIEFFEEDEHPDYPDGVVKFYLDDGSVVEAHFTVEFANAVLKLMADRNEEYIFFSDTFDEDELEEPIVDVDVIMV
jgi:hypothetical protein